MKRTALVAACAALVAALAGTSTTAADTTRVIVAFKPGAGAQMRGLVSMARGTVELDIAGMNAMAVTVPSAALAGLARNPNVEYVEEDARRYPLALATPSTGSPYATSQLVPYGIGMVQADQLVGAANSATRKICIIDSGYNLGHSDLPGTGDVTGDNDSGTGQWSTDENSHGTHVAGTIAALNNAGTGVVGVAPGVKLHIIKVFGADGWAYSSTLAAAANKCKDAGANVISMSLGGSVSNRTEQRAFDALYAANILPIAAAGNGGNTRTSYPAGYASVMSVAAVDEFKALASFSQRNKDVEISGPGVSVLSTVPMGAGLMASLTVNNTTYAPISIEGSPATSASAPLADFGLGTATSPALAGKVCLIQRGTNSFAEKVANCQTSGGVGAVIYNNVPGSFSGTLGGAASAIPSMTVSDTEGAALRGQFNQTATAAVGVANHAYFDGTSMATPHVSAVAAMVWSLNPGCTAAQLRNSLNKSAVDLGTAGRDNSFGFGLVQAKAADTRIKASGCGN
jgi:subtilisin family serine protease